MKKSSFSDKKTDASKASKNNKANQEEQKNSQQDGLEDSQEVRQKDINNFFDKKKSEEDKNSHSQSADNKSDARSSNAEKVEESVSPATSQEQLQAAKDEVLRAYAEMENVRNRAKKDVDKAYKYSLERFAKELLPILDAFEMAMKTNEDKNNLSEGMQPIYDMLLTVMKKEGVMPIRPHGKTFDPQEHEAIQVVASEEHDSNTVIEVMQSGYLLNDRLIRPAMVVIAK